ncbi:MAG: metallopeptidase, partial [Planctomycetes bacterium]|nr:metallopeptidase [Planctomycetota bacterium]
PEIIEAYQQAKADGKYENSLLYNGDHVRHYALTDHKEYFAEATEAYFYRNDFYPFVRAELKEHDPGLHELLEEIWGPLR